MDIFSKVCKLGIIKGGQLGRMLLTPCIDFDVIPYVMDDHDEVPCRDFCGHFVEGDASKKEDVLAFGRGVDILTFEFEHVNLDALVQLEEEGVRVCPSSQVMRIVQDKGLQKEFYRQHDFPTAEFRLVESSEEVFQCADMLPVVQKLRHSGYDGHGVQTLNSTEDVTTAFNAPSVIEEKIDIAKEIAVIVARSNSGQMVTYPVVEMVFHHERHMLDYHFAPADISHDLIQKADTLARSIADKLSMVGVLAVEFFISKTGDLLVNEIAPRPHNSGHHTIEANATSQYEQHLRAILDLPLGSVEMRSPSVMLNLVGDKEAEGPVVFQGLRDILSMSGVHVHRYGKQEVRPYRKMGHVTIIQSTLSEAMLIAKQIKEKVKVVSCQR